MKHLKYLLVLILFSFIFHQSNATNWTKIKVDSLTTSGYAIALNASGMPCVAYSNDAKNNLKYAEWNGSSFVIETVDSNNTKRNIALTFNNSGIPYILYNADYSEGMLKMAYKTGTTWHIDTLFPGSHDGVGAFSLKFDKSNNIHILYTGYHGSTWKYFYAKKTGSNWSLDTLDSQYGNFGYMVLDANDNPHVAYFYQKSAVKQIRYAKKIGGVWIRDTIEASATLGNISIGFDPSGNPHILSSSGKDLKYYSLSGSVWTAVTKTFLYNQDGNVQLIIDNSGKAHITTHYFLSTRYMTFTSPNTWTDEELEGWTDAVFISSLALNASNNPFIAYVKNKNLWVAYAGNLTGVKDDNISCKEAILSLYPNPAKDYCILMKQDNQFKISSVVMVDIQGRIMKEFPSINDNRLTIEKGNLPEGLYLLKIQLTNGRKELMKIVF
jgi:hypothetical protein